MKTDRQHAFRALGTMQQQGFKGLKNVATIGSWHGSEIGGGGGGTPDFKTNRQQGFKTLGTYPPPPCPGTSNVRLRNQGLVLAHQNSTRRTKGWFLRMTVGSRVPRKKNFPAFSLRLSFPTLSHIDK